MIWVNKLFGIKNLEMIYYVSKKRTLELKIIYDRSSYQIIRHQKGGERPNIGGLISKSEVTYEQINKHGVGVKRPNFGTSYVLAQSLGWSL